MSKSSIKVNDKQMLINMALVAEVSTMLGEMHKGEEPQRHPEIFKAFGLERSDYSE